MKVIQLPTTVGGNPQGISKCLNKLGVNSETWVINQNYFGYPVDKVLTSKGNSLILQELKKLFALRYILQCDVAFFNYGSGLFKPYVPVNTKKFNGIKKFLVRIYSLYSGLMAWVEIALLQIFKRPILVQYQGDDARQGDFCRENFAITAAHNVDEFYYTAASDAARRKSIRFYAKKVSKIYALNPDLLHVLPDCAEFLPYSHISLKDWRPMFNQLEDRPLRIGHAPTHRGFKGTDLILKALEELKSEGFDFELVLVENKSNAEAKEIYKTVDFFVDQIFAGWYGGLALEVMALGKPVIAYIRHDDLKFIPSEMRDELPIIQAEPDTIHSVLKEVLKMPRTQLIKKAYQSRAFVEKWHDPISISKRIKADLEAALDLKT